MPFTVHLLPNGWEKCQNDWSGKRVRGNSWAVQQEKDLSCGCSLSDKVEVIMARSFSTVYMWLSVWLSVLGYTAGSGMTSTNTW